MRWKNYSYERVEGGVAITQYLGEETAGDLLAGKTPGLFIGAEKEKTGTAGHKTDGEPQTEKPGNAGHKTGGKTHTENTDGRTDGLSAELVETEAETILQIPAFVDGEPVVEIGKEAFSEYGSLLERIELPPTVKSIGEGAFKMCMSLEELVLPEGVESIGAEAFYLTPLEELYLPSTVREIESPWELSGIRFRVSSENPWYSTDGYGLYREKALLVVCAQEARTEYSVASGTTRIAENAFAANTDLKKVVLPEGVQVIGETAFEGCQNLEEVVLPEGLVEIGANAFSHCIRLRELHLPATLARLGSYALSDTFGWSDTLNGLEKITVAPENTAFYADNQALFQKIYEPLSAGAVEQDETMFATFSLQKTGVKIIKYFGHERKYDIPDGVTEIGEGAFRRADFHIISAPKTLKNVGEDAFRECKNLEEIFLEETGARIYVPQKPIYRKDEITALFYCAEREGRLRGRVEETYDLPEKWRLFARTPIYSGKRAEEADAYGQYVFDYRGYDALFHTYLNLPDQYGMALCRLQFPVLLSADVRRKYEDFLRGHFTEILESLADTEDLAHLAVLAGLGFFTAENIEDSLDVFNRKRRAKQMSYLLDYKREHLGNAEFDFCL